MLFRWKESGQLAGIILMYDPLMLRKRAYWRRTIEDTEGMALHQLPLHQLVR
jgi:hypothetical protein